MSEAVHALTTVPQEPPPRAVATTVTPMQMLQIAVEKGANLEMLERLMTLQERWEENERKREAHEARKAYVVALTKFKADPPSIIKDKKAGFNSRGGDSRTEYSYATLAQITNVIAPALSEHGLSHGWKTEQIDGKVRVTCTLTHVLGHSESVFLEAGADTTGRKNNIQAVGSTISYLERYTLLSITGLAAADQDNDAKNVSDPISAEQKDELIALMRETEADTKKFLEWAGFEAIDDIPANRFLECKQALEAKRRKKANQQ